MNKLSAASSTVHLRQQEPSYPSAPCNLIEEPKTSVYRGRSFTVTPKNPAFVLGEQVLRPAIDNGYYYSCQLINGVRNCLSYVDAGLSKLFTIFPGVSAEPIERNEQEITVLAKDDQNLEAARVGTAFTAYITSGKGIVSAIDTSSNKIPVPRSETLCRRRAASAPCTSHQIFVPSPAPFRGVETPPVINSSSPPTPRPYSSSVSGR